MLKLTPFHIILLLDIGKSIITPVTIVSFSVLLYINLKYKH